jgi:hypothetical protein
MQKTMSACSYQRCSTEQVLIISKPIYNALHPVEQIMAQALERIGKVRIVDEDD